jgi:hypothetical protein
MKHLLLFALCLASTAAIHHHSSASDCPCAKKGPWVSVGPATIRSEHRGVWSSKGPDVVRRREWRSYTDVARLQQL